jgi:hypothetical protein
VDNAFVDGLDSFANDWGGPLMVALFYWFRFHTLKGTRSYTTRLLFYFAVCLFILPFIVIYYFLEYVVGLDPMAATWVLILIWLFPFTPQWRLLPRWSFLPRWWRAFCHGIADIPTHAHNLRDDLRTAQFALRQQDMPALQRKFARIGYQVGDYQAVQSTAIQARFLKISAIMHHLEEWQLRREPFMERNSEHYAELAQIYDFLSLKGVRVLKNVAALHSAMMDDSKVQPDDWHALASFTAKDNSENRLQSLAQTTTGCMLEDLRKDMDFLLESLLLFIARGAFASEWNFAGRRRRLEAIGFAMPQPPRSTIQTVSLVASISLAWSMLWFVFMGEHLIGEGSVGMTRVVVLPSLNLVVNFLLVAHFKSRYAFANEGLFGDRPIAFILTVGLVTAALLFPVRALFDYLQLAQLAEQAQQSNDVPWTVFSQVLLGNLPLSLFPWVTGGIIALLVQRSMWSGRSELQKRLLDGAIFGAGLVGVILVLWLLHTYVFRIPSMSLAEKGSLTLVYGLAFGFGFVVGFLAIDSLREGLATRVAVYQRVWREWTLARAPS